MSSFKYLVQIYLLFTDFIIDGKLIRKYEFKKPRIMNFIYYRFEILYYSLLLLKLRHL